MLPERLGDNKNSLLLPQVQVNNQFSNRLTLDKPTTTPVNKHLRHQLLLSSNVTMINSRQPNKCKRPPQGL
jgi:hypothetical protein